MRSINPLRLAALAVAAALLLAVAAVVSHSVYQDHLKRDCGADCGPPPVP
jgi:Na+(H+)/acetate symporter ActP